METLIPSKKLDAIPSILAQHANKTNEVVSLDSLSEYFKDKIPQTEILLILYKLIHDKFAVVIKWTHFDEYKITFDGLVLYEAGGYHHRNVIAQNETQIVRNETLLVRGTWAAAIVGSLVLFWQVWIWFYPVHKDYPYWFWEKVPIQKHK